MGEYTRFKVRRDDLLKKKQPKHIFGLAVWRGSIVGGVSMMNYSVRSQHNLIMRA